MDCMCIYLYTMLFRAADTLMIMASHSPIHTHIHTPTEMSAMRGDAGVRSRQGQVPCSLLNTRLGGAGDQYPATIRWPLARLPATPMSPPMCVCILVQGVCNAVDEWSLQAVLFCQQ